MVFIDIYSGCKTCPKILAYFFLLECLFLSLIFWGEEYLEAHTQIFEVSHTPCRPSLNALKRLSRTLLFFFPFFTTLFLALYFALIFRETHLFLKELTPPGGYLA